MQLRRWNCALKTAHRFPVVCLQFPYYSASMRISVQIALTDCCSWLPVQLSTWEHRPRERLLTKIGTSQQVVKVAICGFCAEKVSDRRPQRVRQFKWGRKTQCGHGINVSPVVAERPPLNRRLKHHSETKFENLTRKLSAKKQTNISIWIVTSAENRGRK